MRIRQAIAIAIIAVSCSTLFQARAVAAEPQTGEADGAIMKGARVYVVYCYAFLNNICLSFQYHGTSHSYPGWAEVVLIGESVWTSCAPGDTSVANIFIHDQGSPTAGVGYHNATVCTDYDGQTARVGVYPSTREYSTFSDWEAAFPPGVE